MFDTIDDVLTWVVGQRTIYLNSFDKGDITKEQYDEIMNKAIDKCLHKILEIKGWNMGKPINPPPL